MKSLDTFAKLKETALDVQGGELKREKVRLEKRKEPDGAGEPLSRLDIVLGGVWWETFEDF